MLRAVTLLILISLLFSCEKGNIWNLKKLPELNVIEIDNNTLSSFKLKASLKNDGHDKIEITGFCWSLVDIPNITSNVVYSSNTSKEWEMNSAWMTNEKIYVRAFAQNSIGISYSETLTLFYPGTSSNIPVVTTLAPSNIGFFELTVAGNIISDGGLSITEKGFCYSKTNSNPTLTNQNVFDGDVQVTGNFETLLSNLSENSNYYVRAYATNFAGTGYGPVFQVNTMNYYEIGEQGPAGGFVFYSKMDTIGGWHFLEMAATESALIWGNSSGVTNQTAVEIGAGLENTAAIVTAEGVGLYAASSANNYSSGGYSDWFLPSRNELMKVRENLYLNQLGNLSPSLEYWSSSEDPNFASNAWIVKMAPTSENTLSYPKSNTFKVRPIRRF